MSTLGDPNFLFAVPLNPAAAQPEGSGSPQANVAACTDIAGRTDTAGRTGSLPEVDRHKLMLQRSSLGARFSATCAAYQDLLKVDPPCGEVPRRMTATWACAGRALGQLKSLDGAGEMAIDSQAKDGIHVQLSSILIRALATLVTCSRQGLFPVPFGVDERPNGFGESFRRLLGKVFPRFVQAERGTVYDVAAAHEGAILIVKGLSERPSDLAQVLGRVNAWLGSVLQSAALRDTSLQDASPGLESMLAQIMEREQACEDDLSALWRQAQEPERFAVTPTRRLVPTLFADGLTTALIPIYAQSPKLLGPIQDLYRSLGILYPWFHTLDTEGSRIFERANGIHFEPLNLGEPLNLDPPRDSESETQPPQSHT